MIINGLLLEKVKARLYGIKYLLLMILCIGLWISFNSCSSVDYFSYSNHSHGTKYINPDQISLITYNIKAIYEKDEKQTDPLMEYINNEGFDFVIFQELFNEKTRDHILEKTDKNFYNTIIARVDYYSIPEFIFQDAGLFMMGRYPRIDLSHIEFGDGIKNSNGVIHKILDKEISKTNDFLANKSVLGALFEIDNDTRLFLFTTHVQAIGTTEHKEIQLKQIKKFIDDAVDGVLKSSTITSSENLIVLLAGDFNSNAYDEVRFMKMQEILGYPRDLHKEFHGDNKEHTFIFGSGNASRRFDYILAYDSIGQWTFNKVNVQSINAIDITDNENISISDHLGLKATLKINR
jgi:endonuclease/exonuclease/phosphatase family metal-dependent hydrolase